MSQPAERIETLRTTRNAIKILNQAVLAGCSLDLASTGHRRLDLRLGFGSVTIGPIAQDRYRCECGSSHLKCARCA